MNNNSIISFILVVAIFCFESCDTKNNTTQSSPKTRKVFKIEKESPLAKSLRGQGLVDILNVDSTFVVDLKYSSTDNFFGEDVYGNLKEAFLQIKPALALKNANELLKNYNQNYRLLIFDGARPLSIQTILWEKLDTIPPKKRKDFVADPRVGSIHNFGCAVDLSIVDLGTKKQLDMGTKYDFFGDLAYPRLEFKMLRNGQLTQKQYDNRILLRTVMEKSGFMPISSEWWHFNFYTRKTAEKIYTIIQ